MIMLNIFGKHNCINLNTIQGYIDSKLQLLGYKTWHYKGKMEDYEICVNAFDCVPNYPASIPCGDITLNYYIMSNHKEANRKFLADLCNYKVNYKIIKDGLISYNLIIDEIISRLGAKE